MPSKKRSHGRRRKPKQSQAKQPTPTPAAPVSTVKPAEYEMGSASASAAGSAAKPGTTAPSAASTAASTAPTSTAATVSAGVSTGAKVSGGVSTGASVSGATPTGAASNLSTQVGASKVSPQTTPISSAKVPPVSAGSGAASGTGGAGATGVGAGAGKPTIDPVKPKDISKDKVQNTIISSSKLEPSKVTSTGVGSTVKKDDAKSKESKVRVEVPPPATKNSAPATAVDPFDALAGSLPSSEPLAPKGPRYTGPEIKEPSLTSEEAKRCGEKEHTLPPGYRKEDMEKKMPAGKPDKPKEVSKPLTEDDALDSLSAGFVSSAVPSAPKTQATPPISSAKAPTVSAGSGAMSGKGATGGGAGAGKPTTDPVKPKDTLKDKPQSTVISSPILQPPKVTSTGVAKPSATANVSGSTAQKDDIKSKEAKVHAEAAPPAAKAGVPAPAVDPVAPKALQYSGPEVEEPGLTSEVAFRCGENKHTLPPGYRWEDMEKKVPAGVSDKPKEVSKPLTVDEAVDSLSAGFVSSAVPSAPKPETKAESVTAAQSKTAPPPPAQKRQDVTVPTNVSPAPPADKKARVEKSANDSVKAAPSSSPAGKPKTDEGDPMSLDALSALEDTLPAAKPAPESPKLRPEDIVDEKKAKAEKGVRVGEREDTRPPAYRFSEEKHKERPAPPKEPSMDPAEALDILSGDFTSPSVAPAVQAPVPPSAPAKQQPKVEELSALEQLAGDFVAPAQAKKVASVAPPPAAKSTVGPTSDEGDPMSLDALSALGDTLPTAKPVPKSPELRPEDIVDEKKLSSEKGMRVGERDDTLPPDYRFFEEASKKYPAPPKEPSLDTAEALDILSGDFTSPSVAPAVQAPVPPSAPPADSSADFALEELAGDFVAPTAASKVHSAVTAPRKADRQLSEDTTSAMDALSDTLKDIGPAPQPVPVAPKDIVKEKEAVEEKITKAGERDDTLPPDYRPTEADIKAAAEAKAKAKANVPPKQTSMDESTALDALSSDFSAPPVAAPSSHPHTPPAKTPPIHSAPAASGPALDKLATTLLPDLPETKPKDSKPKVKGGKSKSKPKKPAVDDAPTSGHLSGQPSTDVVSTSSTKKGGKS
ncbi:calpastatin isoform X5 [Pygocentrus nattereri]|uniref:calpastatin isoform X5 n=1 Tax=Pygocentrus nattereri TaxID=42514 RepID=UPI001891A737|nr:calpastatin isoform X5 [Pygocentrus nattereri]